MKKLSKQEVWSDLLENHNHSWFEEIYKRNQKNKNKPAMFFRGTTYTYDQFFKMVVMYAKSLKSYGINKGDEFVACLRQTPDYPVLVAAASLIGAKINLIAADFNEDYIADIINKAESKIVLVNNWDFVQMSRALKKSTSDKKIVILPVEKWDKYNNPYSKITDMFFKFDSESYMESVGHFENIVMIDSFLNQGKTYKGKLNGHGKLKDDLAIPYTS